MHLGVNTLFHVPGDVGGTETYLRETLKGVVEEYPLLNITIFTQLDNDILMRKLFGSFPHIKFSRLPFRARIRPLRIVAEQTLLPWYVLGRGIDVLWSPGYTAPAYVHCAQVVTVHDLQYKRYPQDLTTLERVTLDRLVRSACKRCKAIIAVSEFSRKEIIGYGFAPPAKVHAVLEGVNELFAHPVTTESVIRELAKEIPFDQPFILCVAHTYPHKNVHLLVDAFDRIQSEIPHNLVIVGKPRLGEPAVEKAVHNMKQTGRLYRLNYGVPFDSLMLLYQKAELFVLPSGYEGFGLPVLEAMMAGTPVVCSLEASLPEVGGVYPFYMENLTAVELALQISAALRMNPGEKAQRCREARKWAGTFSWQRAARKTISVLSACVDN